MQLLLLVVAQCAVLLWLHFEALNLNLRRLRRYIANHPEARRPGGDVWVSAGPSARYSFRLCERCVDAVVRGP